MFCPPYYRRREFEKSNIDVCTPCEKEGGGAETADGNFHGRMAIACCFETRLCPNRRPTVGARSYENTCLGKKAEVSTKNEKHSSIWMTRHTRTITI